MPQEKKVDALVKLAATLAHELNNIFTAVSGNLSLLEDCLEHQSYGATVVSDVLQTARRGIELSERLQAFAGRQRLTSTRFDLNRVVASTLAGLKQSVLHEVDLELDLARSACLVVADQTRFAQLLEELARNAVAAMDGRGTLAVSTIPLTLKDRQVGRLPAGSYICLTVKDSGQGMPPEIAEQALDPVFSTKTGHQGWGLARCAGFVRQSGGRIILSTMPGQGTSAHIFLPQDGTASAAPESGAVMPPVGARTARQRGHA